jgi:hypothetical protein
MTVWNISPHFSSRLIRAEVGGALVGAQARILVRIHHPVAVEVAETGAVGRGEGWGS